MTRADVRGHDDDGVLEVHRVAQAVGELSVFKYLQQDVEDIRMRFLDFVQQDDRIGRALHALGELTAFFVADVSRRRADQLRDRMLLHEFRHIEADQRFLAAEHELRQGASDFGLADAGGTEEQERTDGPVRALQAGAAAANGAGQRADGFVLEMMRLCSSSSMRSSFWRFFFLDRRDGHAGPARDHVFDVFAADDAGGGFVQMIFFAKSAQVLALFAFLVRIETGLLELVVRDGVFHAVDDELDPLLHLGDFLGQRSLAQLYARAGFVDQVDGLVRQEAVRNVAVRVRYREVDGVVGVGDGVKLLVAVFDSEQNLDGVGFVRRRNFYRLEAAFERAVFFDRLAIFAGVVAPMH